jgi:aryl-alcohol dehydrogenase-like predicted oxidoreductase/RimJ/RimL family protein N-acetyltransferase
MNPIKIKTQRFTLRKFNLNLINRNYLSWFKDICVRNFILFKPENLKDLKKDVFKILKEKNTIFLSISSKKKHIGNIRIHNINHKKQEAWLGILIGDRNYRNKGATPEILESIKNYLLKNRIYFLKLNVDKKNIAALKTYRKSEFVIEKEYSKFFTLKCNLYLKKVILGVAQLQSIYGVTNYKKKKLSKQGSKNIIKILDQSKINEVDTAFNYPVNSDVFKNIKNKLLINTKISISDLYNFNLFINYLKNFNKNKKIEINTLFIHDGNNLLSKNGKKLYQKILNLKKRNMIKKIGISFHDFENLKNILKKFKVDVVQIPFNVIDRRGKKYFNFIKKNKIEIQARSIFLQGSLLQKVTTNKKLVKTYNKIKIKKNIDRVNTLIAFVLHDLNIDKIIIGVRHVKELDIILNFSKLNFKKYLYNKFASNDLDIIDPLRWNELHYHEKK